MSLDGANSFELSNNELLVHILMTLHGNEAICFSCVNTVQIIFTLLFSETEIIIDNLIHISHLFNRKYFHYWIDHCLLDNCINLANSQTVFSTTAIICWLKMLNCTGTLYNESPLAIYWQAFCPGWLPFWKWVLSSHAC